MRVRLHAFAKLNLDLRILAREDTGYHQLETIFQRIALADEVDVLVHDGTGITLACEPPVDVPDTQNLAWRAAAAYRDAAQWPHASQGIRIEIAKRIPTGGGLGGGSADAGAVLRALNVLNPTPLTQDALLTIAATLGADVPFLTSEHVCALAWGRGERMLALDALPVRRVHLATFAQGVNTASAYGALASARADGRIAPPGATMHQVEVLREWAALRTIARNDFETPVFAFRADVATVHADWCAAAPTALVRMSGSGATVFAIGSPSDTAALDAIAEAWPQSNGRIQLVHTETLADVPRLVNLSAPSGGR